jgi:hypothetical protein
MVAVLLSRRRLRKINLSRSASLLMLDRTREEELHEVPPWKANKAAWPRGVRPIGQDELDCLGIDRRGNIYWDGTPVVIRSFALTPRQKFWAVVVALAAIAGGLGSCTQGALMYNEWACREGFPALGCPMEQAEEQPGGT